MMELNDKPVKHGVEIINRSTISLAGVKHVANFDEDEVLIDTTMGGLCIKGEGLHIVQLDLDKGTLLVEGMITGMEYVDERMNGGFKTKGKSFIDKLLR